MSDSEYGVQALAMREEFDKTFALPPQPDPPESVDLLVIRLRGDNFALRVMEIAGLLAGKKIIPLPGATPALLGLAGIRGILVPVWDLATLLGYAGQSRGARWLVLGQGGSPWALAFEGFNGFFRMRLSEIHSGTSVEPDSGFIQESLALGGGGTSILSLPLILQAITRISESSQPRRK